MECGGNSATSVVNDDVLWTFEMALSHWWWRANYWPSSEEDHCTASHFNSSSGHISFNWRNWINGFWVSCHYGTHIGCYSTIAKMWSPFTIDTYEQKCLNKISRISCAAQTMQHFYLYYECHRHHCRRRRRRKINVSKWNCNHG